ncbi:TatD family hydrolase [Mangrovibacterium sp.]|uniref:TatD family hydrolase n=1 Tax=Mangrovibacterium sp. TaxID=1961364 RepID=UPI003564E545
MTPRNGTLKFINLHTHFSLPNNELGLVNHSVLLPFAPKADQLYSVGLHPWNLDQAKGSRWINHLEEALKHPQVLAVGECGIDRTLETSVDIQTEFFMPQLQLAEEGNKPIVLHAVRSYSDLLQLKKKTRSKIPWILHGYQGNAETTKQLVHQGFYFSIGTTLLNDRQKLNQSLREIPLTHLFFETDESTEIVESIYIFAARKLDLSSNELKEQLSQNFNQVFLK